MNERQLSIKKRVLDLLSDQDLHGTSLHETVEKLSKSPDSHYFCSELLKLFVHTSFEEEVAEEHWEKIFRNYEYFARSLNHNVGLRVAIFDYFVNLNKVISSPIMVEIHVFKEAEKLAMVDSLTGIFNRRYFDVCFNKELKRAVRYNKSLSLLMIDLDDFKKINDTRGHLFGDDVLKRLATILASISREEDV
ncbi:MAG: GGDEF domain-containing protein, partial [Gammaproteobacteria bacterium]|nr:GGDEF domain-containing protein [Gammaproteobacteria bacterium]